MNPTTPTSNIGTGAAWKLAAHPWALHPSGFARVEDMATALAAAKGGRPTNRAALKAEIGRREAPGAAPADGGEDRASDAAQEESVSLRRRAAPFVDMLECSSAAGKNVVWGV